MRPRGTTRRARRRRPDIQHKRGCFVRAMPLAFGVVIHTGCEFRRPASLRRPQDPTVRTTLDSSRRRHRPEVPALGGDHLRCCRDRGGRADSPVAADPRIRVELTGRSARVLTLCAAAGWYDERSLVRTAHGGPVARRPIGVGRTRIGIDAATDSSRRDTSTLTGWPLGLNMRTRGSRIIVSWSLLLIGIEWCS